MVCPLHCHCLYKDIHGYHSQELNYLEMKFPWNLNVKGFSKMGSWTILLPCLLSWIRPEAQRCVIDKAPWFNVVSIIMCHNYSEAGLQCKSDNTPREEQQINFVTLTLVFNMTHWNSLTDVFITYILPKQHKMNSNVFTLHIWCCNSILFYQL